MVQLIGCAEPGSSVYFRFLRKEILVSACWRIGCLLQLGLSYLHIQKSMREELTHLLNFLTSRPDNNQDGMSKNSPQ